MAIDLEELGGNLGRIAKNFRRQLRRESDLVQLQGLPELANEVNLGRSSEQHSWVNPFDRR